MDASGSNKFPQYRKYSHGRTFFKIHSDVAFEQLNLIGSAYELVAIEAVHYPERLFIQDMLQNVDGYWENSSAEEFTTKLAWCKANLKAL